MKTNLVSSIITTFCTPSKHIKSVVKSRERNPTNGLTVKDIENEDEEDLLAVKKVCMRGRDNMKSGGERKGEEGWKSVSTISN